MGFLNPLVLAGLAAVSIPIAIHLINKFRIRETRWAAMRFIQLSLQKNQKRIQFEDLLLLILRCLLVALLVLAFARPALKTFVTGTDSTGTGPVTAIILLDNSASMGQSNGVQTRFEEAKKAIEQSLAKMESGSSVALFLASNRADAVIAKPSTDFTRVRRGLELASVSDHPSDLTRCLTTAYETLKTIPGGRREIQIYTDNQKTAWSGWEDIQRLQQDNPAIAVVPRVIGPGGEENLAIIGLKTEGGVTAAKQSLRCRVDIANYGTTAVEGVRVTLSMDDKSPSDEALVPRIEPGATQSLYLFVRFENAGFHSITARIPPDRLPLDNERSMALRVIDKMKALVVEGRSGEAAASLSEQDGFFVTNALVPVPAERADDYYLSIKTAPARSLGGIDPSAYDLIVLCNVGETDSSTAEKFRKYVQSGGALILFPGSRTTSDKWRANPGWGAWLPATWNARPNSDKNTRPVSIQSDNYNHPVSAIWNTPDQGNLGSVTLNNWRPLTLRNSDPKSATTQPAHVVLTTSDGEPFLVEGTEGAGRVAVFSSSATPEWNNFPLHPGFVPLMQRLAGLLTRREEGSLALSPGDVFEWEVPMEFLGRDFSLLRPGAENEKRPGGRIELDRQRAILRYRDTDKNGVYRVYLASEDQARVVFAVQTSPAESDLRQLEQTQVARLTQPPDLSGGKDKIPRVQINKEFWALLVWIAVLIALIEAALAHRFSPSR
jgi:hypothetical protein